MLYSVHSLMGGAAAGVWKVGSVGDITDPSSPGEVRIKQVLQLLQTVFQVTQETMDRLQEDVESRPVSAGRAKWCGVDAFGTLERWKNTSRQCCSVVLSAQ